MKVSRANSRHYSSLLLSFLAVCAFTGTVFSAPRWTAKTPIGKHHVYAVGVGESTSLYEARRLSVSDAMRAFSEQRGVVVESRFHSLTTESKRQIEDEISVKGVSTTLKGLRLVETYDTPQAGGHRVWSLMSMPSSGSGGRLSTIWRSTLVPGWGQFYNGRTWRGVAFLAGTVIGVGGALYTAERQRNFEDQALRSSIPSTRHYYYDQADKYHQGNVILVSLAVASYALNLVDAIFTSSNKADIYYSALMNSNIASGLQVSVCLP